MQCPSCGQPIADSLIESSAGWGKCPGCDSVFACVTPQSGATPADHGTKIHCPRCGLRIAAADLSLKTGWGKCAHCDELFALPDLLPGYRVAGRIPERPLNSQATIEVTPSELILRIPRLPRKRVWSTYAWGCAISCLAFSTLLSSCITAVAIAESEHSSFDALPLTIPFWFVGLCILALVSRDARTVRTIRITATELIFDARWILLHRIRRFARQDIQVARRQDRQRAMANPLKAPHFVRGVEIVYRHGVLLLPAQNDAEADWMIQTVNDFLSRSQPVESFLDGRRS